MKCFSLKRSFVLVSSLTLLLGVNIAAESTDLPTILPGSEIQLTSEVNIAESNLLSSLAIEELENDESFNDDQIAQTPKLTEQDYKDLQKQVEKLQKKSSKSRILPPVQEEGKTTCPEDVSDQNYKINFQNVAFVEYLGFLSKLTNTNFIYDKDDVDFTVSVMADSPTDLKDVRSALMQMLRVQGLALASEGNNIIISKDPSIKTLGAVVSNEMGNVCSANEAIITRVFHLNNVNATKVAAIISSMISETGLVEPSDETHHLVVTDLYSNVKKIADLLKSLDNPEAAFEIGLFHVTRSDIENLTTLAEKILKPIVDSNPFVLVPQATTSTVYVVSSPYIVKKTLEVLKSLDVGHFDQERMRQEGFVGNARFLIYKLEHHKGYQLQQTLQELGAELSGTGNFSEELVMTINTAQWIESTNSLLFIGNQQTLQKVKELLEMLDAPLRQVFIEVLAVRTTINNSLNLGVEYGYRARARDRLSTVGSLLTVPSASGSAQAVKPNLFTEGLDRVRTGAAIPVPRTSNDLGLSTGVIGNVMFAGNNLFFDLAALVNALQQDASTQVLSNPKLVTQDTVPATFYVGSTRPFQTNSILQASGAQSGNFVTASVEYRQLGMTLTVTPYLGNGDMVTLEIDQRSSDYVTNATGGGGGSNGFAIVPVTTDSSLTTRVQVPNKHFLMISGMIEDVKSRSKAAIPCLGGIPVLGDLLGSFTNSMQKDNLIIFIRPHIIDSVKELDEVTEREDEFYRKKTKSGTFLQNSVKLYGMH